MRGFAFFCVASLGAGPGVTCYCFRGWEVFFWGGVSHVTVFVNMMHAATLFFSALIHSFKNLATRTRSLLQDMRYRPVMVLQHMQRLSSFVNPGPVSCATRAQPASERWVLQHQTGLRTLISAWQILQRCLSWSKNVATLFEQ